ncbi:hypothetical protein D9M71_780700 [compost metagenome]
MAQPELIGELFELHPQAHQIHFDGRQGRQAFHLEQRAIDHHHRNAFTLGIRGWQLLNHIAHDPLNARVGIGVFENVGTFHQQSGHCVTPTVSTWFSLERVTLVCASSQEQPTKSSWRLLITWKTSP